MKVPNGFGLVAIKLLKGGGMSVDYTEKSKDGSVTNIDSVNRKSPRIPHPDLTKKLEKLDVALADAYNMRPFNKILKENKDFTHKENEGIKSINRILDNLYDAVMTQIEVREFTLSGEEASRGVVIKGTHDFNGYTKSLVTSKIVFKKSVWGFEGTLEQLIEDIEKEVKLYLFDNKAAQGDLFREDNDKTQETPESEKKNGAEGKKDNVVPIAGKGSEDSKDEVVAEETAEVV